MDVAFFTSFLNKNSNQRISNVFGVGDEWAPNRFPLETALQKLWFEISVKYFEVVLKQEVN